MKNKLLVIFFTFTLITTLGAPQPAHASGAVDAIGDIVGSVVDIAGNIINNAISITSGLIQGSINLITGGSFSDGYKQGFCNLGGGGYGLFNGGSCDSTIGTFYEIVSSSDANGVITPFGTTMVKEGESATYTVTPGPWEITYVESAGCMLLMNPLHSPIANMFRHILGIDSASAIAADGCIRTRKRVHVAGWVVDSLKVDDVEQSGAHNATNYSYTFSNVTANHTISVSFSSGVLAEDGVCSVPPATDTHFTCATSYPSINNDSTTDPTKWTWECPGAGTGATDSCSETKPTPPVVTVSFDTNPVNSGGYSLFHWSATNNPTSCTADWDGHTLSPIPGTENIGPINADLTRSITCTNAGGPGYGSASVTVSAATTHMCTNPATGNTNLSYPIATTCPTWTPYCDSVSSPRHVWYKDSYWPNSPPDAAGYDGPYALCYDAVCGTNSNTCNTPTSPTGNGMTLTGGGTGGNWTCSGINYGTDALCSGSCSNGGNNYPTCTPYTLSVATYGSGTGKVTGSNITCTRPSAGGDTCSLSFASGTPVTLIASPSSGTFAGWSGACSGTGNCSVSMTQAQSVVATFTATSAPTVTLNPFDLPSITVGQSSTISFSSTDVTSCSGTGLWNGDLGGTNTPVGGRSTGAMNTPGTFTQQVTCTGPDGSATSVVQTLIVTPYYTLSVATAGSGTGKVTGSGITCTRPSAGGDTCSLSFVSGTPVTLTATPSSGTFAGWSGACSGTGACNVTMDAAKSVVATFDMIPSTMSGTLSITPSPCIINVYESSCHVDLSWTVTNPEGKSSITSSNPSGLNYDGASDPPSFHVTMPVVGEHNPTSFYLYNNSKRIAQKDVVVVCVDGTSWNNSYCAPTAPTTYILSVATYGTGTGTVTGSGINCTRSSGTTSGTCVVSLASGTSVTLPASSTDGSTISWTGCDSTSGNSCIVAMSGARSVVATFTAAAVGAGGCGTAATNYASSATAYSGTYCSTPYGNSSIPAFPAVGSSSNWYCKNSVGTNDAYCTATHVGCVPGCSPTTASTICSDQSFGDGCGGTCTGTRVCGSSWKEVAP